MAKMNLQKSYAMQLYSTQIKIVCGDGRNGYGQEAPYDVIHVGAAAPEIPFALLDQLAVGGKMVIPLGTDDQSVELVTKEDEDGKVKREKLADVVYVPLTSKEA